MMILISPAKKMDFMPREDVEFKNTKPRFMDKTKILVETLKKLKAKEIKNLMSLSDKLSDLNYERFQNFTQGKSNLKRAAALAYMGDTYQGLDFQTLSLHEQNLAQEKVRIISGLYGLLRPFDEIEPYRLEMKINLKSKLGNNLYEVWKETLTKSIEKELQGSELINLASLEYFSAIDTSKIKVITPIFKEVKNGEEKIISFNAKKARGMMTRFIIKNKIDNINDLKKFKESNYKFNEKKSTPTELLFLRG